MGVPPPPTKAFAVAQPPSPLVHAMSGAVGAVVAMALLYPLDQVRAILQVCRSSEGRNPASDTRWRSCHSTRRLVS